MQRILRVAILSLAIVAIGFSYKMMNKSVPLEEVVEDETSQTVRRTPKRGVASESSSNNGDGAVGIFEGEVTSSGSNDDSFKQFADVPEEGDGFTPEGTASSGGGGVNGVGGPVLDNNSPMQNERKPSSSDSDSRRASSTDANASGSSNNSQASSGTSGGAGGGVGGGGGFLVPPNPNATTTATPEDDLTCSTNVGGGAFGNPIRVSISCSASADIKYCIQEGSCCDPSSAYSSSLVLGAVNGDYCLSFYGTSSSSKVSGVIQQSYSFNHIYPDLQLSFPKIFYQTTQLSGNHLLRSNDFGKPNYSVGEINLKSNDPGPSGLDVDCQEIIENYVTFPAPTPSLLFNPMNMAGISSGDQLNIPLALSKLVYGDNFLTSYVVNNNHPVPLYSCSTTKVTLNDFEYFDSEASHGEAGTNDGRQFAGSFVAYSFFEEDTTQLYRTPAGVATEEDNGQELRVGSFGVFY